MATQDTAVHERDTRHDERRVAKNIVRGSVGNLIEWYDWYAYTAFSVYFAAAFFPSGDQTAQLLNTAAVFAVGFLMRPIGGWILGRYADRKGRRSALTLSVTLMAVGSLIVALTPSYDAIGVGCWYLTAAWTFPVTRTIPLTAALTEGVIGVDTNADHLAAWRLDVHGNPVGQPRRFFYDLGGTACHRDAQVRHALSRLLNGAKTCGVKAIAVEDLDFTAEKTREKHGRKKRFKQIVSGMPTGKLRARLTSMADRTGIAIIAVDPAYTSMWGAQHWKKPLTTKNRQTTRHDAASIAIGRRAQGHPIRRRTAPPRDDQSDRHGHRTAQAPPETLGREGPRPRTPGPRTRCVPPDAASTRATRTPNTVRDVRSDRAWVQDPLLLTE